MTSPSLPSGLYLFLGVSLWCLIIVLPANLSSTAIDDLLAQQVGRLGSWKGPGLWEAVGCG